MILLRWKDIDVSLSQPNKGRDTGWDIQSLIRDKNQLGKAREAWVTQNSERVFSDWTCNRTILDMEVEWIKDKLIDLLNKYRKIMRVTLYSKRWWNKNMVQARKIWTKEKKRWRKSTPDKEKLKQAQNQFYHIIRKAKRECWQNFLEAIDESSNHTQIRPEDKNRCSIAL